MAIEILYLTTQIHRWINVRVADHLAAQATRLSRRTGATTVSSRMIPSDTGLAGAPGFGGRAGLDFSSSDEMDCDADSQIATRNCDQPVVHA